MDKRKRILIFHASIGSGHEVAAKALQRAIQQHDPGVAVMVVDALFPVKERNEWVTSFASSLSLGILSDLYDRVWHSGELRKAYERFCQLSLFQSHMGDAIHAWKPDLVVCTHSLPASVLALWQKEHPTPVPIIAVATDYQVHPYWPMDEIAQFIVPSTLTKQKLVATGMAAEKILPYGIPLRSEFCQTGGVGEEEDRSVLVIAGGRRAADYASLRPKIIAMWQYLNQMPTLPHQWTFVVGTDDKLETFLHETNQHGNRLRVHGYVRDLPKLMRRAQVVVAKPGGLTTAEALALGKPLVCLVSGSGQERANVGFLLATGTGIVSEDPAETVGIVNALLADDQERAHYQHRAMQWGKPDAAEQITRHLAGLLHVKDPLPSLAQPELNRLTQNQPR